MTPDFKKLAAGLRMAQTRSIRKEDPPINRAMVKQLFLNVGTSTLGAGAGIAAGILTGHLLKKHLGPNALKILMGASGAIGAAGALAAKRVLTHGHELENKAAREYTKAMKRRGGA